MTHKQARKVLLLAVMSAVGFLLQACGDDVSFSKNTPSPQGTYNVRLEGTKNPSTALPGEFYVQKVRLEVLKANKSILVDEQFFRADPYEPSFFDVFPLHEWINDATLRFGSEEKPQLFDDSILIRNMTDLNLELLIVNYGRFERFLLFDISPGKSITLQAAPHFDRGQPALGVSYVVYTGGRRFSGVNQRSDERRIEDGSLKTALDITNKSITPR